MNGMAIAVSFKPENIRAVTSTVYDYPLYSNR